MVIVNSPSILTVKPRVCFVSAMRALYGLLTGGGVEGIGGAQVQQYLITQGLRNIGYENSFVLPDYGQPERTVLDDGTILVKSSESKIKLRGFNRLLTMSAMHRAMRSAEADVYYQRGAGAVTGYCALYCKLHGKPFVFSVASNFDLDINDTTWLSPGDRVWYRYGLSAASAVVVQSEDQMRTLRDSYGRDGVLIPSAFSTPENTVCHDKGEYILWVGSFRKIKRPELFVDLAAMLPQYKFVMVGGANSNERSQYDTIVERAANLSNLHLTGLVTYDEAGSYFDGASIFVNTSVAEGFPNTFLQSWCRGVPVVSTFESDGLLSRHGLGVYCENEQALVQAVDALMKDDAARYRMGQLGVEYVKSTHSDDVVRSRYDDLFCRLVGRDNQLKGVRH